MRKFVVARWALFSLLPLFLAHPLNSQTPTRTKYNFNPGWLVLVGDPAGAEQPTFDDHAWKPVTTPYTWNEDSASRVSIHDLPTGIAWYRKHFILPASAKDKKVFLEFEGIRQAGEFFLNGQPIGRNENGVMAFGFDITKRLASPAGKRPRRQTDNRWDYNEKATGATFQWKDRNFYANYGGINKTSGSTSLTSSTKPSRSTRTSARPASTSRPTSTSPTLRDVTVEPKFATTTPPKRPSPTSCRSSTWTATSRPHQRRP